MNWIEITNVNQKIRPIKIGFLVDKNQYKSVFEAVLYNSMLWWWNYNIIIPNFYKTSLKKIKNQSLDLIKTTNPDYIVNLTNKDFPKEIKEIFFKKYLLEKSDFVKIKKQNYEFNLWIRIYPILNELLNDIEKDKLSSHQVSIINFWWTLKNNLDIVINTWYLWDSELYTCFEANKNNNNFTDKKFFIKNHYNSNNCLDIWKYLIKNFWGGWGLRKDIIYVWKKDSINDMINFWNIRATWINWLYVSFEDIDDYKKLINTIISDNYYKINQNWVYNMTSIIKWDSIDTILLSTKINTLIYRKNHGKFSVMNRVPKFSESWSSMVTKEIISDDFFHKEYREKFIINNWFSESLELKKPTFLSEEVEYRYKKPYYVIDLELNSYSRDNKKTFNIPSDDSLYKLIKYQIFNWERLLKVWDKISKFIDWPQSNSIYINKVKSFDIFYEYFKFYWIDIELSEPWVISEKIIEHLGWDIDNCRILKLKWVRDLLRKMSTPLWKERTKQRNKSNRIIRKWMEIQNIIKEISEINNSNNEYHGVLRTDIYWEKWIWVAKYLYEKNIIRPWMVFKCNNCFKEHWYWAEEFQKEFKCKYCFKKQKVTLFKDKADIWWKYKPDWLFMIPEWWQWSIATIVSIWFLHHLGFEFHDKFTYLTSINCQSSNGEKYECDFLWFLWNELIIWEAKNYTELSKKDFTKMINLWKHFKTKPILCFSVLKDEFTEKEKKLIISTQKKGFKVIPLTRKELDPYDLHNRFSWLRNQHPLKIDELIKNLVELNL